MAGRFPDAAKIFQNSAEVTGQDNRIITVGHTHDEELRSHAKLKLFEIKAQSSPPQRLAVPCGSVLTGFHHKAERTGDR